MRVSARKCFDRRFHADQAVESLLQVMTHPPNP
jgi:hypothetical protein